MIKKAIKDMSKNSQNFSIREFRMQKLKSLAWKNKEYTVKLSKKSNLHLTRELTPKPVTNSGAHLRGLAPRQHNCAQRRNGGRPLAALFDLTSPGFEPLASRTDSDVVNNRDNRPVR